MTMLEQIPAGIETTDDAPSTLRVEVITDEDRWSDVEADWRALFRSSPTASTVLRWEWLTSWWRNYGSTYGPDAGGLRIVALWMRDTLVGALPLYLRSAGTSASRDLMFLSTGEAEYEETCADYMDLLYEPAYERSCVDAVGTAFTSDILGTWDECSLIGMRSGSALANLSERLSSCGLKVTLGEPADTVYSDLSGGYDHYLEQLSSGFRKQERRMMRQIEQQGIAFDIPTEVGEADRALDDLILLHERRWGAKQKSGAFSSERFRTFHRDLVSNLVPQGLASVGRMSIDDKPIAVIYGFTCGTEFDFYQCGVDLEPEVKLDSPGIAVNLLLMKYLANKGIKKYDFLKGASWYKERLATGRDQITSLHIAKPSIKWVYREALKGVKRAAAQVRNRSIPGR